MIKKLFLVYKECTFLSEEDGVEFIPLWVCSNEQFAQRFVEKLNFDSLRSKVSGLPYRVVYSYQIIDFYE